MAAGGGGSHSSSSSRGRSTTSTAAGASTALLCGKIKEVHIAIIVTSGSGSRSEVALGLLCRCSSHILGDTLHRVSYPPKSPISPLLMLSHIKQVLDGSVGVVESGAHGGIDLRALEAHGLHVRDGLCALVTGSQGIGVVEGGGVRGSGGRSRRCRRGRRGRGRSSRGGWGSGRGSGRSWCRRRRHIGGGSSSCCCFGVGFGLGFAYQHDALATKPSGCRKGSVPCSQHRLQSPSPQSCTTRQSLHPSRSCLALCEHMNWCRGPEATRPFLTCVDELLQLGVETFLAVDLLLDTRYLPPSHQSSVHRRTRTIESWEVAAGVIWAYQLRRFALDDELLLFEVLWATRQRC